MLEIGRVGPFVWSHIPKTETEIEVINLKIVIPAERLAAAINKHLLQGIVNDPEKLQKLMENYQKCKITSKEA